MTPPLAPALSVAQVPAPASAPDRAEASALLTTAGGPDILRATVHPDPRLPHRDRGDDSAAPVGAGRAAR